MIDVVMPDVTCVEARGEASVPFLLRPSMVALSWVSVHLAPECGMSRAVRPATPVSVSCGYGVRPQSAVWSRVCLGKDAVDGSETEVNLVSAGASGRRDARGVVIVK